MKKTINYSVRVFKTKWFSIDALPQHSVQNRPYYRICCNDGISIIAATEKGRLLVIRQYRPALGVYTLEFPAGYINNGEDPRDAAERELREETGYSCYRLCPLGTFIVAPSRIKSNLYGFVGRDARPVASPETQEKGIELILVTQREFEKLILDGKFVDSVGISIFWLARRKGLLQ